jgi:protein SCO1/2
VNGDTIWHKVGSFEFTNQNNEKFSDKLLIDKIYVADFIFTRCPSICKDMTKQMRRLYRAFETDNEVVLVSHTVDPDYDTPIILKTYAEIQGVKDHDKWIFLTGDKKSLYDVARNQYYATATQGDGGPTDFVHTERFILVDKEKHIRGFYDGTKEAEVNRLMFDIELLKKEK